MQYSNTEILEMSEGGFFGTGNAQLPNAQILMIDRITHIDECGGLYQRGLLKADLRIDPQNWFFNCHFKGDPVMPGCLGLDALWQLLGVFLGWSGLPGKGRALGVGAVKFSGKIYPDAGSIEYQLHIKRVFCKPMVMGIADGTVSHAGKVIYKAENLKVGLLSD